MKKFPTNLRIECLLCAIFLMGATSVAQSPYRQRRVPTPQTDGPTATLEAQPNTAQYPGKPVNSDPPTVDQQVQPNSLQVPAYRPPQTPAVRPGAAGAAPPAMTQAPVSPAASGATNPGAQGQGFIGPPAPLPPTPEHMPPTPAKITYQNGLLSVESTNSRLSDVLNGIHNKTGIQFEGMQPGPDRVAGKFGPAPPDEVLVNLLRGSRFDYVIIGTPENPAVIQRVVLTPTAAGGTVAAAPAGQQPAANAGEEDENAADEGETQEQVQSPPQPATLPRPGPNAAPRTQEQLLEELKLMQQQQQNQAQKPNQNPNAPIKPQPPARRPLDPQ